MATAAQTITNQSSFFTKVAEKPWVDSALLISAAAIAIIGVSVFFAQNPLPTVAYCCWGGCSILLLEGAILWRLVASAILSAKKTASTVENRPPTVENTASEPTDKGAAVVVRVKDLNIAQSYDSATPLLQVQKDILEKLKADKKVSEKAKPHEIILLHGGKQYNPFMTNSTITVGGLAGNSSSLQLMYVYANPSS